MKKEEKKKFDPSTAWALACKLAMEVDFLSEEELMPYARALYEALKWGATH